MLHRILSMRHTQLLIQIADMRFDGGRRHRQLAGNLLVAIAGIDQPENLRVVTNNLNVANTLMQKDDFRIILAGGELRSRDGGIIGEATLDFISQFRLDFGILGISGIDSDGSLLEFDYHEVRTKRAIIENSRHVMLVVDHSKFGRNAMVNMGSISMVDAVYTDVMPPAGVMQVIKDNNLQLELC